MFVVKVCERKEETRVRKLKNRESGIALILAACLLVAVGIGLLLDHFRSVTEVVDGEAEDVDLLITELCAKNASILENGGKYADYIELYNRGDACNLRGFTISDGKTTSDPFGDMPMAAGEYKVLFLEKDTTGFSLSAAGGETVTLRNRDGTVAAQVTTVAMGEDQVMSWTGAGYELTGRATPGFPNTDAGYQAFTTGEPDEDPAVVISELLISNRGVLPDEKGRFCDVVELHNVTDQPVSLGGYSLSDRQENRFRYALPSVTLPADGYLLVYCDSKSAIGEAFSQPHASFGLSAGETAVLTAPNGKYVSVSLPELPDDRTLSLVDGAYAESAVTLGFSNDEAGEQAFLESRINRESPLVINEVLLDGDGTPYGGQLCDAVEIYNRSDAPVDTAGWYLSDDEDPLKYALPSRTLESGECLVLICDKQTEAWHTGFGLSLGETVRLTGPDFRYSEPVTCVSAGDGNSLLRQGVDGGEIFYRSGEVSMGYENTAEGRRQFVAAALPAGLRLSEILASNTESLMGSYGTCCDWVELYNGSDAPLDLSGWYLSDDPKELRKGVLPAETLAPGEYYVVFLSKDTKNLRSGYPVMPFGLASSGDRLYLSHEENGTLALVDGAVIPSLPANTSYGRPAGEAGFSPLSAVSPGQANGAGAAISSAPVATTAQGVYNDVASLDVVLSGEGTIYYTLDCSVPTTESAVYNGSIRLTETTVIRAICCEKGKTPSRIVDLTYLLNEGHTLPVASLVTTPGNLWDYNTGIYVSGPGASATYPYFGSNFWKSWERSATVSLFEKDGGGFTSPCGISIFGGYSRALDMKSFCCYFRSTYGNSDLSYPLFGDEGLDSYESFIFRNCGQDFSLARMRDPMLSELLATKTDVAVQKNRPVVLYLNGEFWGVYYIREKISEHYVAGNFNVTADQVVLTSGNGEGSSDYRNLLSYVRSHNLSDPEAYAYMESQMDIDEYIDYIVAEIYVGNYDNGNIKFCRAGDTLKWTWIMYDVDQSFYNSQLNTVVEHLNPRGTGAADMYSTDLINGLLRNPGFRDQFFRRFAWQIENVWAPDRVLAAIDAYEQAILPDMGRDCEKWGRTIAAWQRSVNSLRDFAVERPTSIVTMLKSYFSLSDSEMRNYGFAV